MRQTLGRNLTDNPGPNSVFIVLDYNSADDMGEFVRTEHAKDIESGKLVYYRTEEPDRFRMAHAKNMAHRCGMRGRAPTFW